MKFKEKKQCSSGIYYHFLFAGKNTCIYHEATIFMLIILTCKYKQTETLRKCLLNVRDGNPKGSLPYLPIGLCVVAHTFGPSTLEAEAIGSL